VLAAGRLRPDPADGALDRSRRHAPRGQRDEPRADPGRQRIPGDAGMLGPPPGHGIPGDCVP